jgi:anti-sigma factor (TIGR02949 family)
MKGCDDYCSSIQLFLDEELSDQDLEECCAPLEGCPACRKELETEETLSHLLHRSRQLYSAPEALRARVRQTMADPLPATPHASMGLRDRVLKVLAQSSQRVSHRAYIGEALAATLHLVIGGGLLLPRLFQRSQATGYVEAAVSANCSLLDGCLPLEVQSDSPDTVTAWFMGKVPFHFRLPIAVEDHKGGYAALVAYLMRSVSTSLRQVS